MGYAAVFQSRLALPANSQLPTANPKGRRRNKKKRGGGALTTGIWGSLGNQGVVCHWLVCCAGAGECAIGRRWLGWAGCLGAYTVWFSDRGRG